MHLRYFITTLLVLSLVSCAHRNANSEKVHASTNSARDTCESPDMHVRCCFRDVPGNLSSQMVIANGDEPGERMVIRGTIAMLHGGPLKDVILYAYHTDRTGIYSKNGNEKGAQKYHGRLYGWCRTDAHGAFEIQTIRPGSYPGGKIPAHIHAAVLYPDGSAHWIDDFVFDDEPKLTGEYKHGIVDLEKKNGMWEGTRYIELGENLKRAEALFKYHGRSSRSKASWF